MAKFQTQWGTIDACMKVAMDAWKAAKAGAEAGGFFGPVGALVGRAVAAVASVAKSCISGDAQKCYNGISGLLKGGKKFYANTKAAIANWKKNWNKKVQTCDLVHPDLPWIRDSKISDLKQGYEDALQSAQEAAELATSEEKQTEYVERLQVACNARKTQEHPYCDTASCTCKYDFIAAGKEAMKIMEEKKVQFESIESSAKDTTISQERECPMVGDQCPTWDHTH